MNGDRGTDNPETKDRGTLWRTGGPAPPARTGVGKFASSGAAAGARLQSQLQAEIDALVREAVRLAETHATLLPPDEVQRVLGERERSAEVAASIKRILGGTGPVSARAAELIRLLESRFILDPAASSLDLLPEGERGRFRNFQWHPHDYPGPPIGPNEGLARAMTAALNAVRPERRAHIGEHAVVSQDEHDARMQAYILGELRPIPGRPKSLNVHALDSLLRMAHAAQGEGVDLIALDAYRSPETSMALASRSGNREAVAVFSVHNLGLAVDFQMSHGTQRYLEATTVPMINVINMRRSPVHKWIFLRGASYGWFPYQNEPWHWEYNPPGFRATFRAGFR